jgi:hypothetical protein
MMKPFATFLVLVVFSCLSFGQKADKPKLPVIWSPDANCHPDNLPEIKAMNPKCQTAQVENMTFYIVDIGGVSYAMTHRPVRDFLVASVQISNKAAAPIEINAKRSRIARYKNSEEYAANVKPAYASSQSQDELRQASYEEGEIGEREGGIRAGLKKRDKFEVDYNRGRIIRRPGAAIDEPEPPPTENPVPSRITTELRVPKEIFENVLKTKTLAAGEKAAGHVVFKRSPEDTSYAVLCLYAGQFEFVFPVTGK